MRWARRALSTVPRGVTALPRSPLIFLLIVTVVITVIPGARFGLQGVPDRASEPGELPCWGPRGLCLRQVQEHRRQEQNLSAEGRGAQHGL